MSLNVIAEYNEKVKEIEQINEDLLKSISKLAECGISIVIDYEKLHKWQKSILDAKITERIS